MDFRIPSSSSLKNIWTSLVSKQGQPPSVKTPGSLFSHKEDGSETRLGASLLKVTLFLTGFLFALSFSLTAETIIMSRTLTFKTILAQSVAGRSPSFANANMDRSYGGFASLNPFGAVMPPETEQKASSSYPVTSLVLSGTLPNIGAWITDDTGTHLVLKGQEIKGYKLDAIQYGKVFISSGSVSHEIFLTLSGGSIVPAPAAPSVSSNKSVLDISGVVSAGSGKEGSVPRELVDKLLMNPYDEIAKMRMVPADGGMQLQRIASDSVLAAVGVTEGDIIKAVNGVRITNMGDVANAVNSMMSGTRFDVSVTRGGKPLARKYLVK